MSLHWTLVAGFLYVEIALCLLLCVTYVSNRRWSSIIKSNIFTSILKHGNMYFTIMIAILILFFLDALREVKKYTMPDMKALDLTNNLNTKDHFMMMMFRAQRNLYISGFSLFLFLVLRRMASLICSSAILEAKCEAAMKQAESASRTAQGLLDDATKEDKEEDEEVEDLKEEIKDLKLKLAESRKDKKTADANVEAMKLQSESTNRAYDQLMKEHERLQRSQDADCGDHKKDN